MDTATKGSSCSTQTLSITDLDVEGTGDVQLGTVAEVGEVAFRVRDFEPFMNNELVKNSFVAYTSFYI